MRKCVFIHTNEKQWLGAQVAAYSLRRNSAHPDAFEIAFLQVRDHPFLHAKEGQPFLRGGATRIWHTDDLQSITPLRFLPPQLMEYQGRAVVMDPDIFAAGDIHELLTREMNGKGIMGRPRSDKKKKKFCIATSVMLMNCEKLKHWNCEREFNELFEFKRDYKEWMCLAHEPRDNIGLLEKEWNDFDHLTPATRLLHNTKRRTQPWKTGLPVDFIPADKLKRYPPLAYLNRLRARWFGEYAFLGRYAKHPDPNQEHFFFGLLKECLEAGVVSESLLRDEINRNHVRPDALEIVEQTPPLPA